MDLTRETERLDNINRVFGELRQRQIDPQANWNASRENVVFWLNGQVAILHQMMLVFSDLVVILGGTTVTVKGSELVAPLLVRTAENAGRSGGTEAPEQDGTESPDDSGEGETSDVKPTG